MCVGAPRRLLEDAPRRGLGADASSDELREYAFKHQMLHQVTYATVLKRVRRELHGKVARWLAGRTGFRLTSAETLHALRGRRTPST